MMAYGPTESPEIAVAIIAEKAGNGYYLAETVRGVFDEYYRLKELRQNPDWRQMLDAEENAGDITAGENAEEQPLQGGENAVQNTQQQPQTSQTQGSSAADTAVQ